MLLRGHIFATHVVQRRDSTNLNFEIKDTGYSKYEINDPLSLVEVRYDDENGVTKNNTLLQQTKSLVKSIDQELSQSTLLPEIDHDLKRNSPPHAY